MGAETDVRRALAGGGRWPRRRWLGGAAGGIGAAVGITLAGCAQIGGTPGGAERAASGASGGAPEREVVLAISRDLANGPQDPFFAHSSAMVWEPLVGLNDALRPTPVLAERWDLSEDGRTWTFRLRRG